MQPNDSLFPEVVDQDVARSTGATNGAKRSEKSGAVASEHSRIVIGVDEAGYGPNIGPLLIAASVWRVPVTLDEQTFTDRLSESFHTQAWYPNCQHVPLGDSKKLYSPATGLRTLEAGWLSMLRQLPRAQSQLPCFTDMLKQLDTAGPWSSQTNNNPHGCPDWFDTLAESMPLCHEPGEIERLSQVARQRLAELDIQLLDVRAAVIIESQFNEAVAQLGSKGRLLSRATMQLVMSLLSDYEAETVDVYCDRQGGRKKYACVLLEAMPDDWFDTLSELPERSSYRRQRPPQRHFHFSVGGDSFPPTALASMTAKYLRERLMAAINHYWQSHVADLQPTAGYPQDAKRYRELIENKAHELGHSVDDWWRVC